MTSERVIKEAPVPVRHTWGVAGFRGKADGFFDHAIAERFSDKEAVNLQRGCFPCWIELSNGQVVIVRAKK